MAEDEDALGETKVELVHSLAAADEGVAAECALGVGHEHMVDFIAAAEQNGEWIVAARLLVAMSLLAWCVPMLKASLIQSPLQRSVFPRV